MNAENLMGLLLILNDFIIKFQSLISKILDQTTRRSPDADLYSYSLLGRVFTFKDLIVFEKIS